MILPERWWSLSPDPLVIAGMNPFPGLPLPGGEEVSVGVGLGGGQQDNGVVRLLLAITSTVGQAAHGHPVGPARQVHLTEEIEQILKYFTTETDK